MAFKATTTRAPSAPSMYRIGTDKFFGIDASGSDENVKLSRACGVSYFKNESYNKEPAEPGLVNFIRTNIGEIGKRHGVKPVDVEFCSEYEKSIGEVQKNVYVKNTLILGTIDDGTPVLHIYKYAEGVYKETVIEFGGMDEGSYWKLFHSSENNFFAGIDNGVVIGKIVDLPGSLKFITTEGICSLNKHSANFYYFDFQSKNTSYEAVLSSSVKIPVTFIAKSPSGGGKGYEPINMLTGWVCEQYIGNGTDAYTLSFKISGIEKPKAFVLSEAGVWEEKTISVTGNKIVFETAPGKLTSGEDNVRIYYLKDSGTDVALISNCTVSCNYGVGGYKDRLFLSGCLKKPNHLWFSGMDDYTYFPETSYLTFGDEKTEVKMIAGQDTNLAVFTSDKCYLVSGTVNSELSNDFAPEALFTISHIFESADPVPGARPIVFNNEIVYLSKSGIVAVTPSNIMDERYTQVRSERVNYWLLKENTEYSDICVCRDFLVLLPKHTSNIPTNKMYVFDGIQFEAAGSKPFSYRQYEAYVWQSLAFNAKAIWEADGKLHLYREGGIYNISFDIDARNESFSDEFYIGEDLHVLPVAAHWETPNLYGNTFYAPKSFAKLGILLRKSLNVDDNEEINTSVRVRYKQNNEPWKILKDYDGEQSVFRYDSINFGMFTYRYSAKTFNIQKKIKIKKAQSLKLRFENDVVNMPLYLQAFGLEYTL